MCLSFSFIYQFKTNTFYHTRNFKKLCLALKHCRDPQTSYLTILFFHYHWYHCLYSIICYNSKELWTRNHNVWILVLDPSMHARSFQLWPTLCDAMDCNPPGSSIHGILQARILECVATPSSRGFSPPRDWTNICLHLLHCKWILHPLSHLGSPVLDPSIINYLCEFYVNCDKLPNIDWPQFSHLQN